ncbi:LacI family DNA-binding transcriptional regulator [Nonomuraea jabiensis]|uniref:DNA-binding LacI/PurR family transcriptional regulator n=1 Tax=Nonomuraea jabiensis TaxID=882448 RepID=A0A7W9G842_9ACTN|nr:LacI family DNA-binding transcriptional regulator [Nonomuraea jabiensis]MBB5778897.1 DNA-binding LacI/PurR family transcriptional regulator [Nonomuraea jabiensis]
MRADEGRERAGVRTEEPVTILTVAREAGVSKTTASDALRGSGRVSERTREAVAQVAERLGYVPNGSARHLRKASTGTIGLHVPEVLTRSSYYMSFVFGVVEQAARHDYDVTLITSGQRRSRPPRVDGLVLGDPLGGDPVVESLMATGLPTVSCERFPGSRQADGVVWSEHASMLGRLLDHLRESGASRPALIVAGDESDWAASVHRGYLEWCAAHGVVPLVRRVSFDASGDEVRAAARALLEAGGAHRGTEPGDHRAIDQGAEHGDDRSTDQEAAHRDGRSTSRGAERGNGRSISRDADQRPGGAVTLGNGGDGTLDGPVRAPAGAVALGRGGDGPLDALVCAPAGAATEVAPLLREAGVNVLLASCVDSAATRQSDPPITAIDLRPKEAGASCAELLFELLSGAAPVGTERVHPIELSIRASTRPRP